MLTPYEKQRLENMARNQEQLVRLGLVPIAQPAPPPPRKVKPQQAANVQPAERRTCSRLRENRACVALFALSQSYKEDELYDESSRPPITVRRNVEQRKRKAAKKASQLSNVNSLRELHHATTLRTDDDDDDHLDDLLDDGDQRHSQSNNTQANILDGLGLDDLEGLDQNDLERLQCLEDLATQPKKQKKHDRQTLRCLIADGSRRIQEIEQMPDEEDNKLCITPAATLPTGSDASDATPLRALIASASLALEHLALSTQRD